jgi:hypothetical protein
MPGKVFVHRVVQDFAHTMVQGALIRAADIHAGLFPDGFKAFKFAEFRRVVVF